MARDEDDFDVQVKNAAIEYFHENKMTMGVVEAARWGRDWAYENQDYGEVDQTTLDDINDKLDRLLEDRATFGTKTRVNKLEAELETAHRMQAAVTNKITDLRSVVQYTLRRIEEFLATVNTFPSEVGGVNTQKLDDILYKCREVLAQ